MSFAKAKLKRFNEISVATPPPTKYNVISTPGKKEKVDITPQLERFFRKFGSPPGSEINSVHSTPCFQTPISVPKKKKFLGLSSKPKTTEALRDKIVECNNKDAYIQELIEQIEELKGKECQTKTESIHEMQSITEKYRELQKEYEEIKKNEDELTAQIEELQKKSEEVQKNCEEIQRKSEETQNRDLAEIARLKQQEKLLQEEIEEQKKQEEGNIVKLEELEKTIAKKSDEIKLLKQQFAEENTELQEECEQLLEIKQLLETEIETLKRHAEENSTLKEHLDQLLRIKTENEAEIQDLQTKFQEFTSKLNLQQENLNEITLLNELQTKETIQQIEHYWKSKLEEQEQRYDAILKECQAISEYSIIQCEVEKNCIKNDLIQKSEAYRSLKMEYDDLVNQVKNQELTIDEMTRALKENGLLLSTVDVDILAYEISIKSFKETIEVLKKRLLDSDRDVMQLKEELEVCEEKVVNYEDQINELSNGLRAALQLNEQLEQQEESAQNLVMSEMKSLEKNLHQRVDDQLTELYEKFQCETDNLKEENRLLSEQVEALQKQLQKEAEEAAEVTKKYIEISGKYDQLWQDSEENLQKLNEARKTLACMETFKALSKKNQDTKIETSLKNDLETKNVKLEKYINKLKQENEELRKQSKPTKNKDKENLASPLRNSLGVKSPAVLKNKN